MVNAALLYLDTLTPGEREEVLGLVMRSLEDILGAEPGQEGRPTRPLGEGSPPGEVTHPKWVEIEVEDVTKPTLPSNRNRCRTGFS